MTTEIRHWLLCFVTLAKKNSLAFSRYMEQYACQVAPIFSVKLRDGQRGQALTQTWLANIPTRPRTMNTCSRRHSNLYASCSSLSQLKVLTYRNHLQVGDEKLPLHKQRVKQHDGTCTGISGEGARHHQRHSDKWLHSLLTSQVPRLLRTKGLVQGWPVLHSQTLLVRVWLHEIKLVPVEGENICIGFLLGWYSKLFDNHWVQPKQNLKEQRRISDVSHNRFLLSMVTGLSL